MISCFLLRLHMDLFFCFTTDDGDVSLHCCKAAGTFGDMGTDGSPELRTNPQDQGQILKIWGRVLRIWVKSTGLGTDPEELGTGSVKNLGRIPKNWRWFPKNQGLSPIMFLTFRRPCAPAALKRCLHKNCHFGKSGPFSKYLFITLGHFIFVLFIKIQKSICLSITCMNLI